MARTKRSARRRGGKRGRESDRLGGASSSDAAPLSKRVRSEGAVTPSPDDSSDPASGLAGIAFEDRDGDAGEEQEEDEETLDSDEFKPTQYMKEEMKKELAELEKGVDGEEDISDEEAEKIGSSEEDEQVDGDEFKPTQYMKEEMKGELAELEKGVDEEEYIRDEEAEEIASSEEDEQVEGEEEEQEENRMIISRGPVRRALKPPRRQLMVREMALRQVLENNDGDDFDPGELDGDYVPDEQIPASSAPVKGQEAAARPKKGKRPVEEKYAVYIPRLWPAGAQNPRMYKSANRQALMGKGMKCLETKISLDEDDKVKIGTLWENMRKHALSGSRPDGSKERDRDDFLKACFRMGRCVEPERMAKLLGGGHRHEDYCRFVLAGFLGLLNIRYARKRMWNGAPPRPEEKHAPVVVHADELYESDDELIKSADAVQERLEKAKAEADAVKDEEECALVEVGEIPAEGDDDEEVDEQPSRLFEELKLASYPEESFANLLSYVQRNYLTNIMAKDVDRDVLRVFFESAVGIGMTFESRGRGKLAADIKLPNETIHLINDSRKQFEDRRKWLSEPMPAPELGPGRSVKLGTIELWRHASKSFSSKHMARISLIQPNRLLDWLTFVTAQTNAAENEEAYYMENNPVVSIAPIPLLYLADLAVDFALKILSVAAALADKEPYDMDSQRRCVITGDDIRYAFNLVVQDREKQRIAFLIFAEPAIADMGLPFPGSWPELMQRPLSEGEDVVLCDRTPANTFRVPLNAVNEARVILDSLRIPARGYLYTTQKMVNFRDPLSGMASAKRKRAMKSTRWKAMHAIKSSSPSGDELDKEVGLAEESAPNPAAISVAKPVAIAAGSSSTNPAAAVALDVAAAATDSAAIPAANRAARSGADPAEDEFDANVSSPSQPNLVRFNDHGESVFDLKPTDFKAPGNIAHLVVKNIGRDQLSDRKKAFSKPPVEDKESAEALWGKDLADCLNMTKKFKSTPGTAVAYHRLGWICLHALGQSVEAEDDHLLGYGSTAHYTNFGDLGTSDRVTMNGPALEALTELADHLVRREAEILMACAGHDDGRPWIDRADVVLVNSVRKEHYIYGDYGDL